MSILQLIQEFRLRFENPQIKEEYTKAKTDHSKSFFKLLLAIIAVLSLCYFIPGILRHSSQLTYGAAGVFLACIILWLISNKLNKYMDYAMVLLCILICAAGMMAAGDLISVPGSNFFFFLGYSFGAIERIFILRFGRFRLKIVFAAICVALRIYFFPTKRLIAIIFQCVVVSLGLFVDYWKEKEDRDIFKVFYRFREGLTKFKNVMVSGLPANILILTKDLKVELFINEKFRQILCKEGSAKGSMPNEWLAKVSIDKDSLNKRGISVLTKEDMKSFSTLMQFLRVLRSKNLLVDEKNRFSFNCGFREETSISKQSFETQVFPLSWDGREAVAVVMNDVTEHYMNLTLKVANANKDKVLAMVSHELRTPLNGILGMVGILERGIKDKEQLEQLSICKSSGKLLMNIVNSILDLGQIRNNKLKLNIENDDLGGILKDIYNLFKFQFDYKRLFLRLDIASTLPKNITTDQNRLRQIIINLVNNAMKFTFQGGVTISVMPDSHRKGYIHFRVSDTGTGIREEDRAKLFQMYGRLDQANPSINTEGVGLGLTIADHLVRLLNGSPQAEGIGVESCVGQGTTFYFSIKENLSEEREGEIEQQQRRNEEKNFEELLEYSSRDMEEDVNIDENEDISLRITPYSLCPSPTLKANESSKQQLNPTNLSQFELDGQSFTMLRRNEGFGEGESPTINLHQKLDSTIRTRIKEKILLVDDSPFNLLVAKHLIENLGYEVETALNGKIAVEEVRRKTSSESEVRYSAVLMDLQMPVMDGYEAARELRNLMIQKVIPKIPIIAVSANDSEDDKMRCKEVGMLEHISKPLDESALRKLLERLIDKEGEEDSR